MARHTFIICWYGSAFVGCGTAKSEVPHEPLKLIVGLPDFPFLVVMTTTPLAAREPYNEEAAASYNTVIDSISDGLIEFNAPS